MFMSGSLEERTRMHCTSYTPGCYYPSDINGSIGGYSWPAANNDNMLWNSGHSFNALLPPPTMECDLDLQKEICRRTILKHESTFKYQVYELHRLYRRQKELMEEARKRELFGDSLKLSFVSETVSEVSTGTHWLSMNLKGVEPSMASRQTFQEPPRFVAGEEQLADDKPATKDEFDACQHSSSQRSKSRNRVLDLELPGDFYIDSEVEDEVHVAKNQSTEPQHVHESMIDSFCKDGSSISSSSCRKINILFDLNEPAHLDEFDFSSSSTLLESDGCQLDIMKQNQDLSEKENSNADCSLSNKETLADIIITEDHNDSCRVSHLNSSAEAACCVMPSKSHKGTTSDSEISEKHHAEANINGVPSSVSSQRKSIQGSSEFPIVVVQALPCINDTSINKSCRSSRLGGRKCKLNKVKPASSHLTHAAADGVNSTAPVSPENWECSPPRDGSPESQLDRSIGSLKESHGQEEAKDRLAADTLILILSSRVQQKYSKATNKQPGCLDWFAGIASTLGNDQETKGMVQEMGKTKGRRKARCGHGKGMGSSKGLKQQAADGKKLRYAEGCMEVWGKKKKRTGRCARSAPFFSSDLGIPS